MAGSFALPNEEVCALGVFTRQLDVLWYAGEGSVVVCKPVHCGGDFVGGPSCYFLDMYVWLGVAYGVLGVMASRRDDEVC